MWKRRYLSEALYPMQSPVIARPRPRPARQPFKTAVKVPTVPATPPVKLTLFDLASLLPSPCLNSPRGPIYR